MPVNILVGVALCMLTCATGAVGCWWGRGEPWAEHQLLFLTFSHHLGVGGLQSGRSEQEG